MNLQYHLTRHSLTFLVPEESIQREYDLQAKLSTSLNFRGALFLLSATSTDSQFDTESCQTDPSHIGPSFPNCSEYGISKSTIFTAVHKGNTCTSLFIALVYPQQ